MVGYSTIGKQYNDENNLWELTKPIIALIDGVLETIVKLKVLGWAQMMVL